MGYRRQARVAALQALYEFDCVRHPSVEALERVLQETSLSEAAAGFARHLVEGVTPHLAEIDQTIGKAAPLWPIAQMAAIDKSILRLAIFEILFNNKNVPAKVAINEAVELAKTFGSDSSSRFVNGVLGKVLSQRP